MQKQLFIIHVLQYESHSKWMVLELSHHCKTSELFTIIVVISNVASIARMLNSVWQGLKELLNDCMRRIPLARNTGQKLHLIEAFLPKAPKGLWTSRDLPAGGGSPELCWDRRVHWWQPTCWGQSQRSGNRRKGWSRLHVAKKEIN